MTADQLQPWRFCDAIADRPPPLIIETYIDVGELTNNQSLIFVDDNGKRWDVEEAWNSSPSSSGGTSDGSRPEVIVERWLIQLGSRGSQDLPQNLGTLLPRTYKNSIVLFRSLYMYAKLFPAWKIGKKLFASRTSQHTPKLRYRISSDPISHTSARRDNLTAPLFAGHDEVVQSHALEPIDSPAGSFSIRVTCRTSCDFRIDESEAFLSSRLMGMDNPFSDRPTARRLESAPTRQNYMGQHLETGSAPRHTPTRPSLADQGQAYGSMSTFHQVGPQPGTSPMSALRAAHVAGSESPEDNIPKKLPPNTRSTQGSRSSLRSTDGPPNVGRRPSVSFMPFKAPSLSASPSQGEQMMSSVPRAGSSLGKSSPLAVLAEARHPSGHAPSRSSPSANEQAGSPSLASSTKPPATARYSSSFGHRKAKLSTGGSKTEDDNSSGKASATSSAAQPGSGVLPEGGTSSGSLQTDDDNISDFLKMLDQKKDLKSFRSAREGSSLDASTKRTSAQLSRFRGMRDSNSVLTDSMSSSLVNHRSSSSSSRQLANIPPMVAGTSMSASSSPGKPISPHTPHTPAIPSRLSANSIAEYAGPPSADGHRNRSSIDEEAPQDLPSHTPGAIDIPTSPRSFHPSYRRSSSLAQGHRVMPPDDDEMFPMIMRSASLGPDDRPPPSRSALIGLYEDSNRDETAVANPSVDNHASFGPPLVLEQASSHAMGRQRSSEGQDPNASSHSRRGGVYRPHIGRGNWRTETAAQGSSSSLVERASAGSGSSDQRGGRYSFSRPTSTFEDEEPLLFAMSDFDTVQQNRRSREDLRGASHGAWDSSGSSRRGRGSS